MPRRRWRLKDRREALSPALRVYLELGLGGLQALAKAARPEGYAAAVFFTPGSERAAAWQEHGEEILAAWVLAHPGRRPAGWWAYAATAPRRCLEGAPYVWKPGTGDWIWRQRFGLPGHPQARRPGAPQARLVFEAQSVYLRRLELLVPGEAERLTPEDVEPEIVAIPELPEMEPHRAPPTAPSAPLASTSGAPRRAR